MTKTSDKFSVHLKCILCVWTAKEKMNVCNVNTESNTNRAEKMEEDCQYEIIYVHRTWCEECIHRHHRRRLSISIRAKKYIKSTKCIHQHNRYEHFDTTQRKANIALTQRWMTLQKKNWRNRIARKFFSVNWLWMPTTHRCDLAQKRIEQSKRGQDGKTNFHRSVRANGNEKWCGTRHTVRRSSTDWHQYITKAMSYHYVIMHRFATFVAGTNVCSVHFNSFW